MQNVGVIAKLQPAGDGGLVVVFGEKIAPGVHEQVQEFVHSLQKLQITAVREIVPSYCSVMIYYDVLQLSRKEMCRLVLDALEKLEPFLSSLSKVLHVPVCYDGVLAPDMDCVLRMTGLSKKELLNILTSKLHLVYLTGFTPGFPYMGNLPFSVPRQSSTRRAIPPGSVGIAGNQTGIYTVVSPGEWNIIGRTPLKIFDAKRANPFLLTAGDYVQFEIIEIGEYFTLKRKIENGYYQP
ncbi:MAG: 5-oxoprolinase subunit PxpB [Acidaminococcaceae bacterium]|nr:5-oxoprolinase subunit PxpB [Acidaminococcaceae bacterium]MDD4722364.1 5-oxoprolinase subunit PxpB [Acidaminococcaceae bacterium]